MRSLFLLLFMLALCAAEDIYYGDFYFYSAPLVKIGWDYTAEEEEKIEGFAVYLNDVAIDYISKEKRTWVISNLEFGKSYESYLTAYNQYGLESPPSNSIFFNVLPVGDRGFKVNFVNPRWEGNKFIFNIKSSDSRVKLRGSTAVLQKSIDLQNWVDILVFGIGEEQEIETDSGKRAFYRIKLL